MITLFDAEEVMGTQETPMYFLALDFLYSVLKNTQFH